MAKKKSAPKAKKVASIIPTKPSGKPPKKGPSKGIARKRTPDGRFA